MTTHISRRLRATTIGALAVLLGLGVAAVAPAQAADDESDSGSKIKVAMTADVDTFNPFLAILLSSTGINRYVYEPLVGYTTDNEVGPGLAEEWEVSEDAQTWTFTIGEDREWSDGEPVTSEDVVFTYSQMMENEALQQANGGLVTNIDSIEAGDEQTVVIELTEPQASNPGQEIPIVPEHIWSEQDPETFEPDTDVVGSGPFLLEAHEPGQSVELKANPRFWRGEPDIPGITYVAYKSRDAAVQGLRSGEVDIVDELTPAQFEALDGEDDIEGNAGSGRRYQAMAINPGAVDTEGDPLGDGNPALQDPELREAIVMAIDKETLLERVMQDLGEVGQTEVPTVYPDFFGFADDTEEVEFDLEAANELLDDAGYERGEDDIRTDDDGEPLELRLMGRNNEPAHAQMADFVKSWLSDIGISVDVSMVTPEQVNEDSTLGRYDLYFTGWSLGPDPDNQLSMNTCDSRPNADGSGSTSENNWCSEEFDQLYDAQRAELDEDERADLVKQAFSAIYEARVNVPIWYADSLEAYRSDRFDGFTRQPEDGGPILNQNGYWGLYGAEPVDGSGSGSDVLGWVVPAGVVILLVAGAAVVVARRRGPADDKE